jgi:hypothetical protein
MRFKQECFKDLTSSEQSPMSGSGDNDNEYSDSMIDGGFPDYNYQILTNSYFVNCGLYPLIFL